MILPDNIFFLTPNGILVHNSGLSKGMKILVADESMKLTPASIELVQPLSQPITPKTTLKAPRKNLTAYGLEIGVMNEDEMYKATNGTFKVPAHLNSAMFIHMCLHACVYGKGIIGLGNGFAQAHREIDGRRYKMDPRNSSTRVEVSTVSGNLVKRIPFIHYSELRRSPELRWGLLQEW